MKVLLIDDHGLFVDGMHMVLARLDAKIEVFDAACYADALPVIEANPEFDLLLLDLGLPGICDVEALQALRSKLPSTPVVVLSSNNDSSKVQQVLKLGAQGYIPKSTSAELLISALRLVLSGGIYIPPEILRGEIIESQLVTDKQVDMDDVPLTTRQYDVLQELVHGNSNKEIGSILGMAESTVRVHIAAILKELSVSNRTRAVNVAIQKGWVNFNH